MTDDYWRNLDFEHSIGLDIAIKTLLEELSNDRARLLGILSVPALLRMPRYFVMCLMLLPEDSRRKYWLSLSHEAREIPLRWFIKHSSMLALRDIATLAPECGRTFVYCLLKECIHITDQTSLFEVVATIDPSWLCNARNADIMDNLIKRISGPNKAIAQKTFAIHLRMHWRTCAEVLACAQHPRLGVSPLGNISPASLLAGFPHLSRFIADAIADNDRALEGPP